jgi:hypothetical protein
MSVKIFISYSDNDKNKMEALYNALKKIGNKFIPIVVAKRTSPNTTLSDKVKESILESSFIVPILTKDSINNQWVNQEVGFSVGRDKSIIPIVDKSIMGDLKGFINNQIDLPFNFEANSSTHVEAANFRKSYRLLVEYLEKGLVKKFKSKIKPKRIRQGETYETTIEFAGNLTNGFFDNYIEHLESNFRRYNWDTSTLSTLDPTAGGNLHGDIDIRRQFIYKTNDWPLGTYKIHVRVYEHPVVGKRGRYFIAEEIHQVKIVSAT